MANKKKNKQIDENISRINQGIDILKQHPLFGSFCRRMNFYNADNMEKTEYVFVDAHGGIYANRKARLEPEEWAHLFAHAVLHLAFGHFDADKMPGVYVPQGADKYMDTHDRSTHSKSSKNKTAQGKSKQDQETGKRMKSVIENSLNNFLADTTFPYDASSSGNKGGGPGGDFSGRGGKMKGNFDGNFDGNGGPKGNFDGNFDENFDSGNGVTERHDGDLGELGEDLKGGFGPRDGQGGNFGDSSEDASDNPTPPDMDGSGEAPADGGPGNIEDIDNITRNQTSSGISLSGTYETAQDYIDALNANGEWVTYDEASNTATITSIADFVKAFKSASKNLGAFDQLDGGQGENTLFGYGDGGGAHFDSALADILNSIGSSYASDYSEDLSKTDSVGNTVDTRLNMYTPLYYLLESSEGYGTSTVAKYWRIRTGIAQSDCALSTEMNLALALENTEGVEDVDFETVWGAGHTEAERTGDSTTNFIEWVNECMKK